MSEFFSSGAMLWINVGIVAVTMLAVIIYEIWGGIAGIRRIRERAIKTFGSADVSDYRRSSSPALDEPRQRRA